MKPNPNKERYREILAARFITLVIIVILLFGFTGLPLIAGAAGATQKTVTYLPGATDTTGSVPIDPTAYGFLDPVTVMGPGSLARPGFTFAGWRAEATLTNTGFSVFPVVATPPADVSALGAAAEAQFMAEYAAWVEVYYLDTSVATTADFPLFARVKVDPGEERLIGRFELPYVPSGDYFMCIWRPGFMPRWSIMTADGISGSFAEKFAPEWWGTYWRVIDGRFSVLASGESVIDIEDAYCLVAGDMDYDGFLTPIDVYLWRAQAVLSPYGNPPSTGYYWRWSADRSHSTWDFNNFAAFDFDGNGLIDTDDETLLAENTAKSIYGPYGGQYPAAVYLDSLGLDATGFGDLMHLANFGMSMSGLTSGVEYNPYADIASTLAKFHQPGDIVNIPGDVVFVAQWVPDDITPPTPLPPDGKVPATGDVSALVAVLELMMGAISILALRRRLSSNRLCR